MSGKITLVSFIPDPNPSPCGYCKVKGSFSSGMWAHYMSVDLYKRLLDRGWRRSGRYVYKPKMTDTCCPLYTIRCDATKYIPTKSQKKVAKKVKKNLQRGNKNVIPASHPDRASPADSGPSSPIKLNASYPPVEATAHPNVELKKTLVEEPQDQVSSTGLDTSDTVPAESDKKHELNKTEEGLFNPNSQERKVLSLKKSKIRRLEQKFEKKGQKILDETKVEKPRRNKEKEITEHLPGVQTSTGALNQLVPQVEKGVHRFSLRLVRADPTDTVFQQYFEESYAVYKKYQMTVHKDTEEDCDKQTYKGFLCDSPLSFQQDKDVLMGSFHQHYIIDDRIVAVGVIDILPECVSSVYFYYDPDYAHLSLGTYSAIREIQLCNTLGLQFYYMGYYVHSCNKMRYKGKYSPSDLLSPTSYRWHSIERCLPLLDQEKYSTFEEDSSSDYGTKPVLGKISFFFEGDVLTYKEGLIKTLSTREQTRISEYIEACQDLAEDMIAVISSADEDSDSEPEGL